MENSIHILLIEDDLAHAELIQRAFEDREDEAKLTIAHSLTEARKYLAEFQPALIIADWRLPDGDSSELLLDNPDKPTPPIIIMTSYGSERNAVNVIKSGALDYIVKSSESMTDMPHIAERAIEQWKTIQDKEEIQIQLTESEAQFRLLAENSSDMISKHDITGIFLYVSPACKTILGYDPDELTNTSVTLLVHPEDAKQVIDLLATPDWNDVTVTVDYRARHKNGEFVWIETTARLFYDDRNNRQEFQASSRNITERKEAEDALQRAHADLQRVQSVDDAVHGVGLAGAADARQHEHLVGAERVHGLALQLV